MKSIQLKKVPRNSLIPFQTMKTLFVRYLVNVVRLIVEQFELGRVVVDVGDADGQLDGRGEAARVLSGCHDQCVDLGLAHVLEVEVLGQPYFTRS